MTRLRLEWSDRAAADIQAIWEYVAIEDRAAADRLVLDLAELFDRTADFPRLGRSADDLSPGYRSLSHKPYLLFYRIEEDAGLIRLMRVIHGARNLPTVLDEE